MIKPHDLFGRDAISPKEKLIVEAAKLTATELYNARFDKTLKDNWDIDVNKLTLEDVERDVIKSILQKYDFDKCGRVYASQIV